MFYLKEHLTINEGEEITGTFSLKPNAKNERDLDIRIKYSFTGNSTGETLSEELDYKMC